MYAVEFLPSAARELVKLEAAARRRVARRIDRLTTDPRGGGAVKLRGADESIEDQRLIVLVIRIGHRRDVHR